ncbi:hypothetical protein ACTXT7_013579, partial [Hymenolepis weldensis]
PHSRNQQQIQQNQQNQTGHQHGDIEQNMRTSQSASCLSAISATQLTTISNGYRSESDPEDEPQSITHEKRDTWRLKKNSTTDAGRTTTTTRAKAATLGRTISPSVNGYVGESYLPHGSGGQEALRLLTATAPATPSGSGLQNPELSGKEKQRYTMLVNTTGSKVTADQLRYVQIHNTPTHLGGGSSRSGSDKKSAPSVSWRMEPHELHTYSPETSSEQTLLNGPGTFVDKDNGYARLGKNTDSNAMPPYDQLVHRSRNEVSGNNPYSDYSNNSNAIKAAPYRNQHSIEAPIEDKN